VRLRKVEDWRKKNGVEDGIGRGAGRESERIEEEGMELRRLGKERGRRR